MECVICKNEIDKLKDSTGKIYWEHGHNAYPLKEGKCCSTCCNELVVPYRIIMWNIYDKKNEFNLN
jgi:hypothetical protein